MDTGEVMTAEEIYARFDSEWVLVGDPETNEVQVVRKGRVLWHGKNKDEMWRKMEEPGAPRVMAILYTGIIPKEAALIYQFNKPWLAQQDAPARS